MLNSGSVNPNATTMNTLSRSRVGSSIHTHDWNMLKSFAELQQALHKPTSVDGHFEWQLKYLIGSKQQLSETPSPFKIGNMKVSQNKSTYTHASQHALQKSCPQGISTGSSNTEILHIQMSHCRRKNTD